MTVVKVTKEQGEREIQERRHSNLVQIQNTWIAVGVTLLALSLATAYLWQNMWVAVILLALFGLIICTFSRPIARSVMRMESNHMESAANKNTRRIVMPNSLKYLATVAAWVLFVLASICLIFGIVYIVLISFNLISATAPIILPLVYVGFGILCLILAFVAAWIRRQIE